MTEPTIPSEEVNQEDGFVDSEEQLPTEQVAAEQPLPTYTTLSRSQFTDVPGSSDSVPLPSSTRASINARVAGQRAKNKDYVISVVNGTEMTPQGDGLVGAICQEDADWGDEVPTGTTNLKSDYLKVKVATGTMSNIENARMLLRARRKQGVPFRVALWHSGFWVRINPPEEGELINLYMEIAQDEIELGRATGGLIFSNVSGHYQERLFQLLMENIHSTSLKVELRELGQYIKIQDLPVLEWGLAAAQYPTGFAFSRACTAAPAECNHIHTETLRLPEMHITARGRLTAADRLHMSRMQPGSHTVEEVRAYQMRNWGSREEEVIPIKDDEGISFTLQMCNVDSYFLAKDRWIDSINDQLIETVKKDPAMRNRTMMAHSRSSVLRQYAHLIKSVSMDSSVFDKQEDIDALLSDFSSDDQVREALNKAVVKFIDSRTISVIAVSTYTCPQCGKPQRSVEGDVPLPDVIPIDPGQVFFHLLGQKLARLKAR